MAVAKAICASYYSSSLLAVLSGVGPVSVRSASPFDATVNTSALAQISNLNDADSWLGYSCASIGGEIAAKPRGAKICSRRKSCILQHCAFVAEGVCLGWM